MHNASCLAGMAFNQTSLGINHSIAHALGGKFHVPHGRANSILLPHVIEYNADIVGYNNVNYSRAAIKYAQIAELIGVGSSNIRTSVKNLVNEIKKIQKEMNMPTKLTQCKVELSDITNGEREIAILSIKDACTVTNPKVPTEDDIISILSRIK